MTAVRSQFLRALALVTLLALLATGCADDGGTGDGAATDGASDAPAEAPAATGSSATADLSGASVALGTKGFTEHFILTQIAKYLLEDAGAEVQVRDLPATEQVRNALLGGDIDAYWEYSGTGWTNFLGNEGVEDGVGPIELYEMVAETDREENSVVWLPPADVNDTYAIAVSSAIAEETGLERLSQIPMYMEDNPDQMGLCVDTTFGDREDGLIALENTYGFEWPTAQISVSDYALVFTSVASGDPCRFGEVFTTDARVEGQDLVLLEDDEGAFISYLPSMTMEEATFDELGAQIEELLAPATEALDQETMLELNARVDIEGEFPEDVARDWLESNGLL